MKWKTVFIISFLLIILGVYKNWFLYKEIIGGDWPYFFNETLKSFSLFPPAWSPYHANGLGGIIPGYFLDHYLYLTAFLFNILGIEWAYIYRIFWFGLFIILSCTSIIYLIKTIFAKASLFFYLLCALIFTTNTYILMVVGGGQMGIALAYACAPFVLGSYIKLISQEKIIISQLLTTSLLLGVTVMFDPRIGYMSVFASFLYFLYYVVRTRVKTILSFKQGIVKFGTTLFFVGLYHLYWILPLVVYKSNPIPSGFLTEGSFRFFSFADFSHALALLHPNWPENIFGKVYFLYPEFIFLPILAFLSILFLENRKKMGTGYVPFFVILALVGVFLAKGSNEPFGVVNVWLFEHVPGMNGFRDPTKFYLLIAVSYALLIPLSLVGIDNFLSKRFSRYISCTPFILFFVFWIFILRFAFANTLGGTFAHRSLPQEYQQIKTFLTTQKDFSRVLWVPKQSRFSFLSKTHTAIEAVPLFNATNSAELVDALNNPKAQEYLSNLGVGYVMIPSDPLGEIYVDDRKYSQKIRDDYEKKLDSIKWLQKIQEGKITIYKTLAHKDRFWIKDNKHVSYREQQNKYIVTIPSIQNATALIFSENYNPNWVAQFNTKKIFSQETNNKLNSFQVPQGVSSVEIYYAPQTVYNYSRLVSLLAVLVTCIVLFVIKFKRYEI